MMKKIIRAKQEGKKCKKLLHQLCDAQEMSDNVISLQQSTHKASTSHNCCKTS